MIYVGEHDEVSIKDSMLSTEQRLSLLAMEMNLSVANAIFVLS